MLEEISTVKQIRKKLGLTQHELAKLSGVSQSLIAKIEAKKIDPTFSKAKKILDVLEGESQKDQLTAGEVMVGKIVSVTPENSLKLVIKKMREQGISQLPVTKNGAVVGIISESQLLDAVMEGGIGSVGEVMAEAPPIVTKTTPIDVISPLLKHYNAVFVTEKGKLLGIITKTDIINVLGK